MLLTSSNGKSFYVWYDAKVSGWRRRSKYQQELLMLILPWKVLTKHLKSCFHIPHLTAIPDSWFSFQISWQKNNDGFPQYWMLVCVVWRCFPLLSGGLHSYGTFSPLIQFICHPVCAWFSAGKDKGTFLPKAKCLAAGSGSLLRQYWCSCCLQVHQEARWLSCHQGHPGCVGRFRSSL